MKRRILSIQSVGRRPLTVMLVVAGFFALAGTAQARTETIEWSQYNMSNVVGWKIYVGSSPGNYAQTIDVQMPTQGSDGRYRFDIEVPGTDPVYVSMTSYNSDGEESGFSNEREKAPTTGEQPEMSAPYWIE